MAQLPGNDKRVLIIGRTGSGKTVAAVFQLALRDWDLRPWYIIDFKGDSLISQIPGLKYATLDEPIKTEPGIYRVTVLPGQEDKVEAFLWALWRHENVGLYIDEGYMIDQRSAAFQAILTQGRSKNLSLVVLTQRPKWITRFAISEADFFQVFWLTDADDRKTISRFLPVDMEKRLKPYHSWWYDVSADEVTEFSPVPRPSEVIAIIQSRLPKEVEKRKRKAL